MDDRLLSLDRLLSYLFFIILKVFHFILGSADKKQSATDDHLLLTSVILSPSSTLKTTFSHMKIESSFGFMLKRSSKTKIKRIDIDDSCNEEISLANFADFQPSMSSSSQIGTYSCNIEIDSFWPLCMYELRGKCNNEECPSQHLKEYSKGDMNQHTNYNDAGLNSLIENLS